MNVRRRIRSTLAAMLLSTIVLSACQPGPEESLDAVTVQLKWFHRAQFAGFYAADQNGTYAQEGLKVTFMEAGPQHDKFSPLLDGSAQFAVVGADEVILARARSIPIRAIAVIYRQNPTVFFALANKGIASPRDFSGQTIRAFNEQVPILHAISTRVGVSPSEYHVVSLPSDVALVLSGVATVWGGYITSLALEVQLRGHEINVIYPDDYGVHFYGDTLITTEALIADQPDLVLRFLRASLVGWGYAVENADQAGELVRAYQPEADEQLQIAQMTASLPLINTGTDQVGWMRVEIWQGIVETLYAHGIIDSPQDLREIYTMRFLNEVYR